MAHCNECSTKGLAGDNYCRQCGEDLPEEEVIKCDCGVVVSEDDNFCHACGAGFEGDIEETARCVGCGEEYDEGAKFCQNCGVQLPEVEESDEECEEGDESEEESEDEPEKISQPQETQSQTQQQFPPSGF
ncbi:hypothetical protein HN587_04650 [Candidatus Woesearchaeota archaeon]|jgi:hypothetical protein|nr:hypothetical protein [Candidatus Woesearchaeota archaeon]